MRIITLQQPWATLVARGGKTVENRRWSTSYRGLVAIHAGKDTDRRAFRDPLVTETLTEIGIGPGDVADLPAGVVVAVARLDDAHPSAGLCCVPWGDQSAGYQHLLLSDVRPLVHPVATTGQLGLRTVDDGLVERIMAGVR